MLQWTLADLSLEAQVLKDPHFRDVPLPNSWWFHALANSVSFIWGADPENEEAFQEPSQRVANFLEQTQLHPTHFFQGAYMTNQKGCPSAITIDPVKEWKRWRPLGCSAMSLHHSTGNKIGSCSIPEKNNYCWEDKTFFLVPSNNLFS